MNEGVNKLIDFWAYFLDFLLSYLSLSCSFVCAPYLNNPGLPHNLNTLIPFRILMIIYYDNLSVSLVFNYDSVALPPSTPPSIPPPPPIFSDLDSLSKFTY